MTRRNEGQILRRILELSRTPQKKTWLVYRVNTNFRLIKRYLEKLISRGLLEKLPGGLYHTTERGLRYVEAQAITDQLLKREEETIISIFPRSEA